MKNWQETERLMDRVHAILREGGCCAVGTVVSISGSAYRRPGAKLLVEEDGRTSGGVSGGCLEADVREIALATLHDGASTLRRYDTGADEDIVWGLGLGCNGTVEILIQPYSPEGAAGFVDGVRALLAAGVRFAVATALPSGEGAAASAVIGEAGEVVIGTGDGALDERLARSAQGVLEGGDPARVADGDLSAFIDVLRPPPEALICGAGDDAIAMAAVAAQAGFRVAVADHRPAFLTAERFPGARLLDPDGLPEGALGDTFAVVMTHNLERDRRWVHALAGRDAPYIGLLGPRARREDIFSALDDAAMARIFGPVGLDIGADGPEQVAVSVVAEMLAVRSGREPRHLRDRERPIHAD
ncbi:MAG: XdhC family protein [Gemmatimonadota bacterium]